MKPTISLSPKKATESSEFHLQSQNQTSIASESSLESQRKNQNKLSLLVLYIQVFCRELLRPVFEHLRRSSRIAKTYMADGNNSYIWVQEVAGGLPRRIIKPPNGQKLSHGGTESEVSQ